MSNIKSTSHSTKFANKGKLADLNIFLMEYRRCLQHFVDFLWNNGYRYTDSKGNIKVFNIKLNLLDCPSMLKSGIIQESGLHSFLSGRALKCCMGQAAGIVSAAVEKQRKRLYVLSKSKDSGSSKKQRKLLARKIRQNIPQKPNCSNAKAELCSICCDFRDSENFLRLKSITKTKLDIKIPIRPTRPSIKFSKIGKRLNSFLIGESCINIRWELPETILKEDGLVVGADQGLKDVLTLSNGTVTNKIDRHKHSLDLIIRKVCRKKRGSKAFARAKAHQTNFVNWSINQLNLSGIKELRLEKIWNIGFRSRTGKKLSHWQNTVIRNKIESKCRDEGVRFTLSSSTYRSQRCSVCGNVRKANRKGKIYECKNCGQKIDSDLNAAINHSVDLPEIPYVFRNLNLNRGLGFFWKSDGLYDLDGRSLQSPPHV
ncbi:MAG: transposase [Richelia sp. RM2_1_2]|nr:transposase [Richelia sp. RM2_1_2]